MKIADFLWPRSREPVLRVPAGPQPGLWERSGNGPLPESCRFRLLTGFGRNSADHTPPPNSAASVPLRLGGPGSEFQGCRAMQTAVSPGSRQGSNPSPSTGESDANLTSSGHAHTQERHRRGPSLAEQVADQLMAHDAIGAHARDELGFAPNQNPVFVEVTSDADWATGIAFPAGRLVNTTFESFTR